MPALKVADLGCGEGYLAIEAARWASRVDRRRSIAMRCSSAPAPWRERRRVANVIWKKGELEKLPLERRVGGRRDAVAGAAPRAVDPVARGRARRRASPSAGGRVLVLDLRAHQRGMGAREARRSPAGIRRRGVEADADGGRARPTSKSASGRGRAGDPFTVLIASGTKTHGTAEDTNDTTKTVLEPARSPNAILVLDGAMGTMIQRLTAHRGRFPRRAVLPVTATTCAGDSDVLVLTRPDAISGIHHQYLEAGSRHHRDQHVQQHRRSCRPTTVSSRWPTS